VYSKPSAEATTNEFVQSLTAEQRVTLAEMLRQERAGAIFDALSCLTWWLCCRNVGLTFKGQPISLELTSGEGLHGDYIGRCNG
jgi:hypothetical protein